MKLFGFHRHRKDRPWDGAPPWAIEIREMLALVIRNQEKIMSTLDDVLADVTAESTQIDSVSALVSGLKQQLSDALSGTTLPAPVQAKVDAIFTQAEANKAKIAQAIQAGTPAEGTPVDGSGSGGASGGQPASGG